MYNKRVSEIYTIVVLSPLSFQQKVDDVKKSLELYESDLPLASNQFILKNKAHFAIKRSFTLKTDITEEQLIQALRDLKFPSLFISSTDVGTFAQSNYGAIVYLKIDVSFELKGIHQSIKSYIDNLIDTKNSEHEGDTWLPHMTFSYKTPLDSVPNIMKTVKSELLPFEYTIDKLYLLREIDGAKDLREIVKIFDYYKNS